MSSPILASCAEIVATLAISLALLDLAGRLEQALGDRGRRGVDAALERDRVGAGGDVAQALVDHGLGQHGGGRRAVTGDVVGLGGDLLGELGAEVLVRVLQLDLAGDGHAVVGDGGSAPLLVDDDVAALGAERHLDGVREAVDAALQRAPRVLVETPGSWPLIPQFFMQVCPGCPYLAVMPPPRTADRGSLRAASRAGAVPGTHARRRGQAARRDPLATSR